MRKYFSVLKKKWTKCKKDKWNRSNDPNIAYDSKKMTCVHLKGKSRSLLDKKKKRDLLFFRFIRNNKVSCESICYLFGFIFQVSDAKCSPKITFWRFRVGKTSKEVSDCKNTCSCLDMWEIIKIDRTLSSCVLNKYRDFLSVYLETIATDVFPHNT